jgi:hypothetical protein
MMLCPKDSFGEKLKLVLKIIVLNRFLRNRIVPVPAPRMAAANAFYSQPSTFK